ncbi:MAG: methylated-DNA--[protein]-cysteine S-methyltransferase [Euryarchaeota archaeon]|nr:methylated-DNA--[protein]-cysteine S-methyltransferase [Euryarchaeota archaeon]
MNVSVWGFDVGIEEGRIAASDAAIRAQLREYERGERAAFDLGVRVPDSFAGAVMGAMAAIPYGETRTYGELADELGTEAVAVGRACGRNPVPILIPCHRVVGADSLGGFSAGGDRAIELKSRLLDHERRTTQARLDAYR